MSQETQAEMFIRTLTELWEDERTLRQSRLRHEIKEQVQRFVQGFLVERRDRQPRSTWASSRTQSARTTLRQIPGE